MKRKLILILPFVLLLSCSGNKTRPQMDKGNKAESKVEEVEHPSIHQQESEEHKESKKNKFTQTSMIVEAASIETITEDLSQRFTAPVFTTDGNKIVFTTENYIGIWVYDLLQNTVQQINSLPGSGYNFSISNDGRKVYFRNKTQKAKRHGGKYSIIEQNIITHKMNILYTTEKIITTPLVLNNTLLFLEDGKLKEISLKSNNSLGGKAIPPVYFVVDNKLMRYDFGKEPKGIMLNNMRIISAKYTYDNKNIVCLTANNGLLLLDLYGNVVNNFSKARTLTKLFNSYLIALVEEKDDGMKITKSEMYIGFINSSNRKKIANMEEGNIFSPSWSPKENQIVYSNAEGKLKIVKLNIKREETK